MNGSTYRGVWGREWGWCYVLTKTSRSEWARQWISMPARRIKLTFTKKAFKQLKDLSSAHLLLFVHGPRMKTLFPLMVPVIPYSINCTTLLEWSLEFRNNGPNKFYGWTSCNCNHDNLTWYASWITVLMIHDQPLIRTPESHKIQNIVHPLPLQPWASKKVAKG